MRHVDHVALAWRLLGELPPDAAFARLEETLRQVATDAGLPQKYDAQLTRDCVSRASTATRHRMLVEP